MKSQTTNARKLKEYLKSHAPARKLFWSLILLMIISPSKPTPSDVLTPDIRLGFSDFSLLSTQDSENLGYLVFQAKSRANDQLYHIRALNLNSIFAEASRNRATTLFLQETLRLCMLAPDCIVLDSLEFYENRICYALKPVTSAIFGCHDNHARTVLPQLDIPLLLKSLLGDISYLSKHRSEALHFSPSRFYQIKRAEEASLVYFLQDWNQVVGTESKTDAWDQSSTHISGLTEQENIYELAMSILELHGESREEIKATKPTKYYDEVIKAAVWKNQNLESQSISSELKNLLVNMLNKDSSKRPKFNEILRELTIPKITNKSPVFVEVEEGKKFISSLPLRFEGEAKIIHPNVESPEKQPIAPEKTEEKLDSQSAEQSPIKQSPPIKQLPSAKPLETSEKREKEEKKSTDKTLIAAEKPRKKMSTNLEVIKLLENPNPLSITIINLSNSSISAEDAVLLSKNSSWGNLINLNLRYNSIGDQGAAALSMNKAWTNFADLNLQNNSIGVEGAVALSQNSTWKSLATLDLSRNLNIGPEGAIALSMNTSWKNLSTLDLTRAFIGPKGATALGMNSSWVILGTLILRNNAIGEEGVIGLSKNASWTVLTTLDLSWNWINNEGAAALSCNNSWGNLTTLNLSSNLVDTNGTKLLIKRWPSLQLKC